MGQKCCVVADGPPGSDLHGEVPARTVTEDVFEHGQPTTPLWMKDVEEHTARVAVEEQKRQETEAHVAEEKGAPEAEGAAAEARAEEEQQKAAEQAAAERAEAEKLAAMEQKPVKKREPRATAKSRPAPEAAAKAPTSDSLPLPAKIKSTVPMQQEGLPAGKSQGEPRVSVESVASKKTSGPKPESPQARTKPKPLVAQGDDAVFSEAESAASKAETVASSKAVRPKGRAKPAAKTVEAYTLKINIIGAKNLRNADNFGHSDPFCVCEIPGKKESRFQTHVIDDNPNPVWNHCALLTGFTAKDKLKFQLWDKDTLTADDTLGHVEIDKDKFHPRKFVGDLALVETGGGRTAKQATVQVEIEVMTLESLDPGDIEVSAEKFFEEHIVVGTKPEPPKLMVTFLSATGLRNADDHRVMNGVSDPYCVCEIPGKEKKSRVKTPVVKDNLNPVWNHTVQINGYELGDALSFAVLDKDLFKTDDVLGRATMTKEQVEKGWTGTLQLKDEKKGSVSKAALRVKVRLIGSTPNSGQPRVPDQARRDSKDSVNSRQSRLSATTGTDSLVSPSSGRSLATTTPRAEEATSPTATEGSRSRASLKAKAKAKAAAEPGAEATAAGKKTVLVQTVKITIIGAKGLRNADSFGQSDPFCVCEIVGKPESRFQTRVIDDNANPVWNHCRLLYGFLPTDRLSFEVWDKDTFSANDLLGKVQVSHDKFYPSRLTGDLELLDHEAGKSAVTKKATLQVEIEVTTSQHLDVSEVEVAVKKYTAEDARFHKRRSVEEQSKLLVTFISAQGLRNADMQCNGVSDPYCVCEIPGKSGARVKTPVVKDSLDPVWNYTAQVMGYEAGDSLSFAVLDKDFGFKKDDVLGRASLSTEQIEKGWSGVLQLKDFTRNARAQLKVKVEVVKEAATAKATSPRSRSSDDPMCVRIRG